LLDGLFGRADFRRRLPFGNLGLCLDRFLYEQAEVPAQLVGDIVL
jgi:hypothetical protein